MVDRGCGSRMAVLWTCTALLALVSAGPLSRFPRESEDYQNIDLSAYANFTANEVCFSEGEVFQKGDVMPNPGPCEECRCEPPSIVCQMVRCPVNNNGCRTIQKSNHCCPDYKCECDYNNQLYGDGERIDLPEDPCQVCYCKGGEVMCTSLKCYVRNDCEPQHVPGQCCPKYENCPIRGLNTTNNNEDKPGRSQNKTTKREMQPWLLTKVSEQTSSVAVPRRSGGVTTEGSGVVIVSDWLTERRTTPEDMASQEFPSPSSSKEGPSDDVTTDQQQNLDGSVIMRKPGTVAPLDEVIFTRIDMLRDRVQENQEPSSSAPEKGDATDSQDSFDTTMNSKYVSDDEITSATAGTVTLANEKSKGIIALEEGATSPSEVNDQEYISNITEKNISNETISDITETSGNNPKEEVVTNVMNINRKNKFSPTQTPIKQVIHDIEMDNPDLVIIKDSTQSTLHDSFTVLSTGLTNDLETTLNVKNHNSELLFGTPDSTEKQNEGTSERESPASEKKYSKSEVKLLETGLLTETFTENYETATDYETTTENQHVVNTSIQSDLMVEEEEVALEAEPLNAKYDEQSGLNRNKVTDNEIETTTPYFTEDHVVESGYRSGNLQDTASYTENFNLESTTDIIHVTELELINDEYSLVHTTNSVSLNEATVVPEVSLEKLKHNNISQNQSSVESEQSVESSPDVNNNNSYEQEQESVAWNDIKAVQLNETEDLVSNAPPVLELNSHVPFLQLGGHEGSDSSSQEDLHTTSATNENEHLHTSELVRVTNKNVVKGSSNLVTESPDRVTGTESELRAEEEYSPNPDQNNKMREYTSEKYEDTTTTTSHILLTPGDLRVLAEYIINKKIKPVESENYSDSSPNQWLKGNLTSSGKVASILSAANVSIGVINRTETETSIYHPTTISIDSTTKLFKGEDFDADPLFQGNSIQEDSNKAISKKNYLHNKINQKLEKSKNTLKFQTFLNTAAVSGDVTTSALADTTSTETNVESLTPHLKEIILQKKPSLNKKLLDESSNSGVADDGIQESASTFTNSNSHNETESTLTDINASKITNKSSGSLDQHITSVDNKNIPNSDGIIINHSDENKDKNSKFPSRVERISQGENPQPTSSVLLTADTTMPEEYSSQGPFLN